MYTYNISYIHMIYHNILCICTYNILIVVADCCFNPIQQHHHETSPDFVPGCLSGHLRGGLGLGPRSVESFIEI